MKRLAILLGLVILTLGKGYAQYNVNSDTTAIGLGATSTSSSYKFSYNGHLIAHYGLGWYDDPDLSGGAMAYLGGYAGIKFFTNGSPKLDINYNGNVGIGTTSPTQTLDVQGNIISGSSSGGGLLQLGAGHATGNYGVRLYGADNGIDGTDLQIQTRNTATGSFSTSVVFRNNGNIIIGNTTQTNPTYRLDIYGPARANKMVVNATGADFVFDSAYKLPSFSEIEKYIRQNHHLSEIPSAAEMQKDGMDVGGLNTRLLQKVEELTLYLIEKDKQLKAQDERLKKIEAQLDALTQQKKD